MSVQRWTMQHLVGKVGLTLDADSNGEWVTYSDHACIVAEAGAAVFAFHPEWTVTGMCDSDCLACRRLTELITEREKGYEEGKADAEQAHAAALAAVPDFSPQRDDESDHEYLSRSIGRCAVTFDPKRGQNAAAPRTLTADDPEPAVGSVVLFDGLPYIRQGNKWVAPRANSAYWYEFMRDERPTVLIHDGEDR